jgi:dCMP deaminase
VDQELTSLDRSKDIKWQQRFLALAAHISTWSKDPHTKVGAVIVNDKNHIISVGYNGFPRGVDDTEARYSDRELKYKFVCHAERNAIDNAHTDVSGCTLYLNSSPDHLLPCNECAKSIIQRGIKRVVCETPLEERPHMNWDITKTMFQEAGIELILV